MAFVSIHNCYSGAADAAIDNLPNNEQTNKTNEKKRDENGKSNNSKDAFKRKTHKVTIQNGIIVIGMHTNHIKIGH